MAKKKEIDFNEAFSTLQAWYFQEVDHWAKEFDRQIKEGEFKDREDFLEQFNQDTDGAPVVIYGGQAMAALLASKNSDAYVEEFGEVPVEGDSINWSALALMAFQADIHERMESDTNDDATFEAEEEDEDE